MMKVSAKSLRIQWKQPAKQLIVASNGRIKIKTALGSHHLRFLTARAIQNLEISTDRIAQKVKTFLLRRKSGTEASMRMRQSSLKLREPGKNKSREEIIVFKTQEQVREYLGEITTRQVWDIKNCYIQGGMPVIDTVIRLLSISQIISTKLTNLKIRVRTTLLICPSCPFRIYLTLRKKEEQRWSSTKQINYH